jgi:hypothetical protein
LLDFKGMADLETWLDSMATHVNVQK